MKQIHGLTLIELMITLAVIAIIVAVGLPRLEGMSSRNRLTTEINRLAIDLAFARSEAIKRNTPVSVISNANTDWTQGWTIQLTNAPNTVLRTASGLNNTFVFAGSTNGTITFNADGSKSTTLQETIKLCRSGDTTPGKTIDIISSGRHRTNSGVTCP